MRSLLRVKRYTDELEHAESVLLALARSVVHDIGKIGLADAILLKKGPLMPEEWEVMRGHPVISERICHDLRSFRLVLPIIRHHREKQDGSGYPDGLKDEEVPLTARVQQVVDVYDALTTERPYKAAMSPIQAFETINEEVVKGWWDPEVVAAFQGLVLNNGSRHGHV